MTNNREKIFFKRIYNAAKKIDEWPVMKRKNYFDSLRKREKIRGKSLYGNIIRVIVANSVGRKNFIKLYEEDKL